MSDTPIGRDELAAALEAVHPTHSPITGKAYTEAGQRRSDCLAKADEIIAAHNAAAQSPRATIDRALASEGYTLRDDEPLTVYQFVEHRREICGYGHGHLVEILQPHQMWAIAETGAVELHGQTFTVSRLIDKAGRIFTEVPDEGYSSKHYWRNDEAGFAVTRSVSPHSRTTDGIAVGYRTPPAPQH